jgi:hypothetical protein
MRRTIPFLLVGALFSALVAAPSATDAATSATDGIAPKKTRIYAYYYLWWSTRHWHDELGPNYPYKRRPLPLPATLSRGGCNAVSKYKGNQLIDVPSRRLFTQDNPEAIRYDVRRAAQAGLAGFLVNWHGTGEAIQQPDDISFSRRLESVIGAVHDINADGFDFKLWLNYKASSEERSTTEIMNDLGYIKQRYGTDPAWDHHYSDRIMLAWGGSRKYPTETIQAVSTRFRSTFFFVGDENWKTWDDVRAAFLDGDQYYWSSQNPYSNPDSFEQLAELARLVRQSPDNLDGSKKLWFSPLAPGYNSELLRGGSCVPRRDGQTLRRLFAGNSASEPDGWVLISWNEIAEGTYVRPLRRWADHYLRVLQELGTSS